MNPIDILTLTHSGHCLIGPGVFDGISARVASTIGFDFLYLAGSGATGSFVGEPDLSTMTATEFATIGGMMVQHTDLPVIADADTGFGGPLNIARTVRLYEHAGVAGCHIEDQVFPKRCGQLKGKDVVDLQVYLERIRSAVMARVDPDFVSGYDDYCKGQRLRELTTPQVIIARTDARQATRYGGEKAGREAFEEGVKRLKAALDAGADMAFMESPRTEEECSELVRALAPKPVLINVLPQVSHHQSLTGIVVLMIPAGTYTSSHHGRLPKARFRRSNLSVHWLHSGNARHAKLL